MLSLAISVAFPIVLISLCCVMFTVNDSQVVDCGMRMLFIVFGFISVDMNIQRADDDQLYLTSCRL